MSPPAALLSGLVLAYRWLLSPLLPGCCRYQPTCSSYAMQALRRFGALRGGWLAARRFGRCHPWGGAGYDPVPPAPAAGSAGSDAAIVNAGCCPEDDGRQPRLLPPPCHHSAP